MDATAFVRKALADDFFGPDVQVVEEQDRGQVVGFVGGYQLRVAIEPQLAGGRLGGLDVSEEGFGVGLDCLGFLVRVGGEEPEVLLFGGEGFGVFGDASLSQEERLAAIGEGSADDGPFF
jgi:hypothetical protein